MMAVGNANTHSGVNEFKLLCCVVVTLQEIVSAFESECHVLSWLYSTNICMCPQLDPYVFFLEFYCTPVLFCTPAQMI